MRKKVELNLNSLKSVKDINTKSHQKLSPQQAERFDTKIVEIGERLQEQLSAEKRRNNNNKEKQENNSENACFNGFISQV